MNAATMQQTLRDRGIRYVLCQSVDIYGVPKAKLVPVDHVVDLELPDGGAFFAGFATFGGMGQGPHSPDLAAIPDFDTLTVLPWRPDVARFACDVYLNGEPSPHCTRSILKRLLARARERGWRMDIGIEPEFFLVRRGERGLEPFDELDTLSKPCYDLKGVTRSFDFLDRLVSAMQAVGWDVLACDHEDANGQFEIDLRYADALTSADRYVFFRYMAGVLAHEMGAIATFMPKPFPNRTGNGAHFHISLADVESGRNLFEDPGDPQGLGLSRLAYQFMAGVLDHAAAICAFTSPTVNSYKRLIASGSMSGATWAPVCVTYGRNNRTQMIRVPAPGRFEHRGVDSSCNPYLAAAAILVAGMDGIDRQLDPGPVNERNLYELSARELQELGIRVLPASLRDAALSLAADPLLRSALGEEFVDAYVDFKLGEWSEYHNSVSPWEVERYATLF